MKSEEERRSEIREQLIYDIKHPEEKWYSQSRNDNRDIIITAPECPYASGCGRVSEHRYVWWKHHKNDPPLKHGDIIHHINGNHKDNRIENLVRVSAKEHRRIHGATIKESKRVGRLNKITK